MTTTKTPFARSLRLLRNVLAVALLPTALWLLVRPTAVKPEVLPAPTPQPTGQTGIPLSVLNILSNTNYYMCGNKRKKRCCGQEQVGGPTEKCSSFVDLDSYNYVHDAIDYRQPMQNGGGGGCGSCGSASFNAAAAMEPLTLKRFHRLREVSLWSNLGPGVFTNFDIRLDLVAYDRDGSAVKSLIYFDPADEWESQLVPTATPGVFTDPQFNRAQQVQLYSAYNPSTGVGTPVVAGYDWRTVSHAVMTKYDGSIQVFQFFDPATDPSPMQEQFKVLFNMDLAKAKKPLSATGSKLTGIGFWIDAGADTMRFDNFEIVDTLGNVVYRENFPLRAGFVDVLADNVKNAEQDGFFCTINDKAWDAKHEILNGGAPDLPGIGNAPFPGLTGTDGCLAIRPQVSGTNWRRMVFTTEVRALNLSTANIGKIRWQSRHDTTTMENSVAVCVVVLPRILSANELEIG